MLILLDARPLQYAAPDNERTTLILSITRSLARDHGIKWLVLVDHTWQPGSLPGITEEQVLVKRALPGRAGWRLWYDWQIPRLVRKLRPDRVMLTGGIAAKPLSAPQSVWMPVCANPKQTKMRITLYAPRLGETLLRGESFFCFSEKDREWLASRDHEPLTSGSRPRAEKFHLIWPWLPAAIAPLPDGERAAIKNNFAQGREFFFADVSDTGKEGMLYLLKAFSIFKKRQLSNLQLLIAGDPAEEIKGKLETYKYRQDVHWCLVSDVRNGRVPAAAYAALYLFGNDSPGSPMLEAWATGVPVLVTAGNHLAEMAGDAALAAAAGDPTALAGHLMSIYKDEALRGRLIQRGFSRLPEFAAGATIAGVWAVINRVYEINK